MHVQSSNETTTRYFVPLFDFRPRNPASRCQLADARGRTMKHTSSKKIARPRPAPRNTMNKERFSPDRTCISRLHASSEICRLQVSGPREIALYQILFWVGHLEEGQGRVHNDDDHGKEMFVVYRYYSTGPVILHCFYICFVVFVFLGW